MESRLSLVGLGNAASVEISCLVAVKLTTSTNTGIFNTLFCVTV